VIREQGGDFAAQAAIVAAGLAHKRIALGWIAPQRLVEDFLNLLPSLHGRIFSMRRGLCS
jgi:hypothetical protein